MKNNDDTLKAQMDRTPTKHPKEKVLRLTSMRGSMSKIMDADVVYLNGKMIKNRNGALV